MREYTIEYHTQNIYDEEVKEGHFELMIIPCNSEIQKLQKMEFSHSLNAHFFLGKNKYGFETLHVRSEKKFNKFNLHFKALVSKLPSNLNLWNSLSPEEEKQWIEKNDFYIQYHSFLDPSPLTRLNVDDIPTKLKKNKTETIGAYLNRLNCQLKELIQYQFGETSVHTTAQEALLHGRGVCQDFSHIMIGILRQQHIPARYVSGYLDTGLKEIDAQLHAWVEAFVPTLGWKAFDPANQLMEDTHYIKIAHGRDYSDCQPIKGVLFTQGKNQTQYKILVKSNYEEQFFAHQQQQTQKLLYF